MVGYVTLGSNNLEQAKLFYDALFAAIGIPRAMNLKRGGAAYEFPDGTRFIILSPENDKPASVGNGTMVGLHLATPEQVDAIHDKALELGGSCEGEPGLRQANLLGVYISYFRDPEGHKFSAVTMLSQEEAASGRLRSIR